MLLNLLPVKIPPFLCFIKGASCLWIIRVSLMFGSVETSPTALSNQRINKVSEGMISSRCFYSPLPNSFSSLCLCYLYPVSSGTVTINSLSSALVSDVCSFLSLFWTSSSPTEQLLLWYFVAYCTEVIIMLSEMQTKYICILILLRSVSFRFSTSSHLQ